MVQIESGPNGIPNDGNAFWLVDKSMVVKQVVQTSAELPVQDGHSTPMVYGQHPLFRGDKVSS